MNEHLMPTAVGYTIAAFLIGAILSAVFPQWAFLCYIPALITAGVSIPLAVYVDFFHS